MLKIFKFVKKTFTKLMKMLKFFIFSIIFLTLTLILSTVILIDRYIISSNYDLTVKQNNFSNLYNEKNWIITYEANDTIFNFKYLELDSILSSKNISNTTNTNTNTPINDIIPINSTKTSIRFEDALLEDGKKIVYLTFDDGPSTTITPKVLETLKKYNINATFFLLGNNIQKNSHTRSLVRNIYTYGNAIGNHTYSHDLNKLYPNNKIDTDYFMSEVYRTNTILKDILGNKFNTRLIRLPGGYMSRSYYHDPNLPYFDQRLKQEKYLSVDWNASDSDAEGKKKISQELLQMVKESVSNKNKVIILMHDTYGKEETAKALPSIIEYLSAQGYEFKTLE
ncbi:polysaccharide deacetylase family protein [Clostridium folliculivorans]|nr:polysaccharide deacetylase family protein [Clostridium folliculivorans]